MQRRFTTICISQNATRDQIIKYLDLVALRKLDEEVKQSNEGNHNSQKHTHTKPWHMVKNRLHSLILHEAPSKMNWYHFSTTVRCYIHNSTSEFYGCSISFASNSLCLHAIYNTFGVRYYGRKTEVNSTIQYIWILLRFYRSPLRIWA